MDLASFLAGGQSDTLKLISGAIVLRLAQLEAQSLRCDDHPVGTPRRSETIPIRRDLRGAHRFVLATRETAKGVSARDDGRLDIGLRPGIVQLLVSREQLQRALLIARAVLNEAERRGYEIKATRRDQGEKPGVAIVIRGHTYQLYIAELTERVPVTAADVARWRRENSHRLTYRPDLEPPEHKQVSTGRLRLSLPTRWGGGRSTWNEGPRGALESKLASVFAELERRADEDDARAIAFARAAEERRQAELVRIERERRARLEQARAERLTSEAAVWRTAGAVRDYVAALRERLDELDAADRERVERWCDWAEDWVKRSDPVANVAVITGLDDERDAHRLQ